MATRLSVRAAGKSGIACASKAASSGMSGLQSVAVWTDSDAPVAAELLRPPGDLVEFKLITRGSLTSVRTRNRIALVNAPEHPRWLIELAENVAGAMYAHDVLSPVGCHFHQGDDVCEVLVFASQTEVFGGRRDGKRFGSRFTLDVQAVLKLFTSVEAVEWQALRDDADDEIGAHLAIMGEYEGCRLCLRIPAKAPDCFEAGRIANVLEGRFINMW